jgi:hypothetical protein
VSRPVDPTPSRGALPVDHWAEQARRRAEADRRRRRRATMIAFVVLTAAAAAGVVVLVALRQSGPDDAPSAEGSSPTSEASVPATGTPSPVTRPATLATLDEVWLVDRRDGTYEWGVTVRSTADDDRGPLEVEASLRDDDRVEVAQVGESIAELAAGAEATIGGVVADPPGVPTRLAVDVSVGRPLPRPALEPDAVEVVALSRRVDGSTGEDVVVGRLRSRVATDVEGIRLALLWRDDAGEVVTALYHDVDRVRPGVDARFEVPVGDRPDAEGLPADVSWSR